MNQYKNLNQIENRLEELYDAGCSDSPEYIELEALANKFANLETERQEKVSQAIALERKRIESIKALLLAGDLDVIDAFGMQEFGEDYEVAVEGTNHVVYSMVAREDQQARHLCNSAEEARLKLRKLVWDRLYTKYVRSGDMTHLSELAQS